MSKKMYEDYLQELDFNDVKNIYNKIPDSARKEIIGVGKDATKAAGIVVVAWAASRLFSKYLNKCHSKCKEEKGLSFGEEKLCYVTCRIKAMSEQIKLLQKYIGLCNKSKNPKMCESRAMDRIQKLQVKLRETIRKRDQLRLSLIQKGRNLEPGERKKY